MTIPAGWNRTALRVALLSLALSLTPCGQADEAPPPAISAAEALAAYDRFRAAPEARLSEAPTFLRYMQGGEVHTVLNSRLVFFMYRDIPPDVQAVLYASYMGGNLESQLRTRRQGDDPVAGMRAVLNAYAALKETHAGLVLAELEALAKAAAGHDLETAVTAMADGKL